MQMFYSCVCMCVCVCTLGVQFQETIPERCLSWCPARKWSTHDTACCVRACTCGHVDVHMALLCTIMDVCKDWFSTKEQPMIRPNHPCGSEILVQSREKSPCLGQWVRLAAVIYEGPWNLWKVVTYNFKGMLHGALCPPKRQLFCRKCGKNVGEKWLMNNWFLTK